MGVNIQWTRGGVFASSQFYLIAPAHSDFRYREYLRRQPVWFLSMLNTDISENPLWHKRTARNNVTHSLIHIEVILPEVIKCFLFKALMNMAYLSSARILCTHLEYSTCSRALVNFAFYARVHVYIFSAYTYLCSSFRVVSARTRWKNLNIHVFVVECMPFNSVPHAEQSVS